MNSWTAPPVRAACLRQRFPHTEPCYTSDRSFSFSSELPPVPHSPPGYQARQKKARAKSSRSEQRTNLPSVPYSLTGNLSVLFSFAITVEHRVDGFLEPSGMTVRSHACMVLLSSGPIILCASSWLCIFPFQNALQKTVIINEMKFNNKHVKV